MKIVDTGEADVRLLCCWNPRRCCCSVGQRVAHQLSYRAEMVGETAVTGVVDAL